MKLINIPALQDNYIWLLSDHNKHCVIIDPGESRRVLAIINHHKMTPDAILLTHHHFDHVGGIAGITARYPNIPVYGPRETAIKGASIIIDDGDIIMINNHRFISIAVPGHTLGHVAYYSQPYLFCGDTLFSAGCGRIFEGTTEQMYASIQRIMQFPDETLICCAHEYTLSNIAFARHLLPDDNKLIVRQRQVVELRANNQPSVPTTLALERMINIFLRCNEKDLQNKLGISMYNKTNLDVFSELRARKNLF